VAEETFYVDDRDGRVILRRRVQAGETYRLVIRAQDGGEVQLNDTTYVTVNVIASQGNLVFGKILISILTSGNSPILNVNLTKVAQLFMSLSEFVCIFLTRLRNVVSLESFAS